MLSLTVSWGGLSTYGMAQIVENEIESNEILTRGPVHEAFAGASAFDPMPGITVPRSPPESIEEIPPSVRPEGENIAWIPGYWAWDDDDQNFLWVSGTWRNLPPGRQWISGYWAKAETGVQWTSGYWADAESSEIEYLPEPPESIETGPNVAAPSADDIWLPGCWIWDQNRYAWQPGFWAAAQPNWIWNPSHYTWSSRGYVFVSGYWDHTIDNRGVLFAPVRFNQSILAQQNYRYTPSSVLNVGGLINHLFLRPNYGHYYYGDYYENNYAKVGYLPSFSYGVNRHGYDPIFAHQRWENRTNKEWENRIQGDYQRRRDNESDRPPRTFSAQQELLKRGIDPKNRINVFTQPLVQATKSKDSKIRYREVDKEDHKRFSQTGASLQNQRLTRQELEKTNPVTLKSGLTHEPSRGKMPFSPVRGNLEDKNNRSVIPKTLELPKTDPKVTPTKRRSGPPADKGKAGKNKGAGEQ
ncbi:MAG: hypothetical protein MUC83_04630 [Pirellula sp.]|nr:hypothetical protein [Pirellula sp.]